MATDAVEQRTGGHEAITDPAEHAAELFQLAVTLLQRYKQTSDVTALAGAIQANEEACQLARQGTLEHVVYLDHLSMLHAVMYLHTGDDIHISTAIAGHEVAVRKSRARGMPASLLAQVLHNTATDYLHRYGRTADLADLGQALRHMSNATELDGLELEQATALYEAFTKALRDMYRRNESLNTLNRLIEAQRVLISLQREPAHLGMFGDDLVLLFLHTGALQYLDEAAEISRAAVDLARATDPDNLLALLTRHGYTLQARYAMSGNQVDLDAAIAIGREAVALAPLRSRLREELQADLANTMALREQ